MAIQFSAPNEKEVEIKRVVDSIGFGGYAITRCYFEVDGKEYGTRTSCLYDVGDVVLVRQDKFTGAWYIVDFD